MGKTTQHHGTARSAGFFRHEAGFDSISISVLSGLYGPSEALAPSVSLQIWAGEANFHIHITPAAARELAAMLIAAADAGDAPAAAQEAPAIPVALYREPEAA